MLHLQMPPLFIGKTSRAGVLYSKHDNQQSLSKHVEDSAVTLFSVSEVKAAIILIITGLMVKSGNHSPLNHTNFDLIYLVTEIIAL